jgi:ABC-2 type transport system ATP-binding protein
MHQDWLDCISFVGMTEIQHKMILDIQGVTKRYGDYLAVNDVSLQMRTGSIFGLLGPNGAGKTSLIRMITTITAPDSGVIYLDGERLNPNSPGHIGYMPEERGLYKKMKVGEHLIYLARLKDMTAQQANQALDEWLTRFEITDWYNKPIEDLSKGMQQKVQFISTVLHKPKLLILDEPFSGLDPINTNLIKAEIHRLNREGQSIIFSTHRMEQVEEMCDSIALINQGKNILHGDVREIKNRYKEHLFELQYEGQLSNDVPNDTQVVSRDVQRITLRLDPGAEPNLILKWALSSGLHITGYREILPSFNDIFIATVEGANIK